MLVLPKVQAVSRFWKCDREGRLVAEVACFDDWPDYPPSLFDSRIVGAFFDPGIMPSEQPTPMVSLVGERHQRNMDLGSLLFEVTMERRYVLVEQAPTLRGISRPWGLVNRKVGVYEDSGHVRWEIGVEAAVLSVDSAVVLLYRIRAGSPRRKTRAQVEEVIDSLRIVKAM